MRHILDGDAWAVDVYDVNRHKKTYIKFKPSYNQRSNNEIIVELSLGDGIKIEKFGRSYTVFNQFKRVSVYVIPASESRVQLKTNRAGTVVVFPKRSLKMLTGAEQGKIITGWQILNDIRRAIQEDYESDTWENPYAKQR